MELNCEFPEKLGFLFKPARYKVARGGRGSGKSWGFARALLILGLQNVERVLCTREIQKSIKQSVHQLIRDQIQALGLSHFYEVLETEIRGQNGTRFYFAGLSDQTADSIKSFEGCTKVWVEEGQNTSKRSWDILIPTIRTEGSEIWVTYNPELDTDPTHVRFVMQPPEDCVSVIMNWRDNPWFPEVLEKERQDSLKRDPEGYKNIWEGDCKPAVTGAIYYNEVAAAESRICNVPYDPMLKVHVVFDLGWNDAMAISLVQVQSSEIRLLEYIEDSHKTLDYYSNMLKAKNLNWGNLYLPHDGRNKDFKTGKSAEEIMTVLGWSVRITPSMSVEDGIRVTRMTFSRIYFDRSKTERLIECAKRYRRQINAQTQEAGAPLHDEFSHGADNLRYVCINAETMTNETWGGSLNYRSLGVLA
jgi:phage terminase large subunit